MLIQCKDAVLQFKNSHFGGILWLFYLHNGIPYTGKITIYIESGRSCAQVEVWYEVQ